MYIHTHMRNIYITERVQIQIKNLGANLDKMECCYSWISIIEKGHMKIKRDTYVTRNLIWN